MVEQKKESVKEIGTFKRTSAPAAVPPGIAAVSSFLTGGEGSFLPTPDPEKEDKKKVPTTDKATREAVEQDLDKIIEDVQPAKELTFEQKLELYKLTKEDANNIVSAIFDNGFYEHTYQLTQKYAVTYRTRSGNDQAKMLKKIDEENPAMTAGVSSIITRFNLATSMMEFKNEDLRQMPFDTKYEFVCALPEAILRLLSVKLSRFDQMVLDLTSENAVENF